jgi:Rha family phage regulatory protein
MEECKMKNELMIFEHREQAVVSSRVIAERFGKQHQHVTQSIENLTSENSGVRFMFRKSYYETDRGRSYKEYLMNRDGFSLLVMGFTGKDALEWKVKYIQVFNAMEAFIKERQSSEWLVTRKQGKLIRRNETDTIANLIDYAKAQGSRNADKFYMCYSKLVNGLVGIETGQRESVPFKTLSTVAFLEDMILHTVDEEMQKGTHYKDISQLCKSNGDQIMRFAYLPRIA